MKMGRLTAIGAETARDRGAAIGTIAMLPGRPAAPAGTITPAAMPAVIAAPAASISPLMDAPTRLERTPAPATSRRLFQVAGRGAR